MKRALITGVTGSGQDLTIEAFAGTVRSVVDFAGTIVWATSRPDGAPRKCDVTRLSGLGWMSKVSFPDGTTRAYQAFLARSGQARRVWGGRATPDPAIAWVAPESTRSHP